MARYQEKQEPRYADILPATADHIAVIPASTSDEPKVVGQIFTPNGLVKVFDDDLIIDWGERTTPRYSRISEGDLRVFFDPAPELPALGSTSSAEPVPPVEGGE